MTSLHEELASGRPPGAAAVTLGVFDGVHRGHCHLIAHLQSVAARQGVTPVVVTFRNHPITILRPDVPLAMLTTLEERLALLRTTGGEHVVPITFTRDLSLLSAEAFVSDAGFRKKLRAKVRSLGGGFESHLPKSTEKVVREDYSVVYGIMRKPYADGSIGLPFFSKVSLQAAVERIRQFGIPIAIELIEKPPSEAPADDDADEGEET